MSRRYKHGMNWIRQEKRLSIYIRDHFACLYCGVGVEDEGVILCLDHVNHNGGNEASNLVTACMECNRGKWFWSLKRWLKKVKNPEKVMARIERALATPIDVQAAKAIRARRNQPF